MVKETAWMEHADGIDLIYRASARTSLVKHPSANHPTDMSPGR